MNKRKKQEKQHRKLNIRFSIMIVLVMYLSYALASQVAALRKSDDRITQLEKDISEAEGRLAEVHDLNAFSHSDAYIEKVAREKLGLVLPDETVFTDVTGR